VAIPITGDGADTDEEAPEHGDEEATDESDFLVDFPDDTEVCWPTVPSHRRGSIIARRNSISYI
jgi:hypothetical protein